ncbi:IS4 family transposase [Pontiellaceae bacterium B12227]|nr:IS4 family transposase [Pontiellaceae bacterium B12227]
MKTTTPYFDGFHIQTLNRKRRSIEKQMEDQLVMLRQKSLSQLSEYFGRFIPSTFLQPSDNRAHSRRRVFSKSNTFWGFFSQVLSADGGCKEVVLKMQSYASMNGLKLPSSSTSAYCQARKKLQRSELMKILKHTAKRLNYMPERGYLNERRVVVVDGTGVSMPDTPESQAAWPQLRHQKQGCGFPTARICAFFSLATGGLLSFEVGNKKSAELPLFRKQWDTFETGDIFLGDKGFCSYYDLACLKGIGVDSVVTLACRKAVKASEALEVFGANDLLISWKKPRWRSDSAYTHSQWEALPAFIQLRQIHVTVNVPGYRTESFHVITTLTDADQYPAADLANLYLQRWNVELFFRHIKTTMGMDILRCKNPDAVFNEIIMHFIVYNSIRMLMYEAAEERGVNVNRLSFKGAVQALRQWEPGLNHAKLNKRERRRIQTDLYNVISDNRVPLRPGRSEPRCVKRRPKPYQLLTTVRDKMIEHRLRNKHTLKMP